MRRLVNIILIMVVAVLLGGACQRRPFAENRSKVVIALNINTDIINHTQEKLPENMRVDLYDPNTAELMFTDYVGPTGGVIHPAPGIYNLIIYNIGTETTHIQNERNYNTIEAYTNEVAEYLKSKMSQFLASRAKAAKERTARLMGVVQADDMLTKDSADYTDDSVVNQPDHIFVGWYHNLDIPVTYEDEPVIEVNIEIEAHTLVETWQVEIRNVTGTEHVSETAALVSGQMGAVHIGTDVDSEKIVSVFFDMKVDTRDDGGKIIKGKYNTFGIHPDRTDEVLIDLNVQNKGGGHQSFQFDVSEMIKDNPRRYILIEDPITIDEAGGDGGGFHPKVDDWEDINTDINL